MLNDKSAIEKIKSLYPDLVIVSAIKFPKMYAFFMTKEGEELTTDDAWYCLDIDGNELFINPLSDPSILDHAEIMSIPSYNESTYIQHGQKFVESYF